MISIRLAGIALAAAAIALLPAPPAQAARLFFSGNGSGTACSAAAPCTLTQAASSAVDGQELTCADNSDNPVTGSVFIQTSIVIDCAGTAATLGNLSVGASGTTVVLRNLTVLNGTIYVGYGTLILDHVHVTAQAGSIVSPLLHIWAFTPNVNVVVKDSLFDNGSAGAVVISAAEANAGGSVRLDRVTITGNAGPGIKIDATNGPFTVDIADSEISSNTGTGVNVVCPSGGPALLSISRSVIAKNGTVGVQTNGTCAVALVDTTLLDSNANGATSIVSGGHLYTYGTNRFVNSLGAGFNGTAGLQ